MAIHFSIKVLRWAISLLLLVSISGCTGMQKGGETLSFNYSWKFLKSDNLLLTAESALKADDRLWEDITLPHTSSMEPLVMKEQQWTGVCWYKKVFTIDRGKKGKHVGILIEAAMNDATIWFNGVEIKRHPGGYLPFYIDISDRIRFDSGNILLVRLDNRANPSIPPGKPLKELDFNYYSGIYRNAYLIVKDKLHFTDPLEIDTIQGGGIIINTEKISAEEATLSISASVINQDQVAHAFSINAVLRDPSGTVAAAVNSESIIIPSLTALRVPLRIKVSNPQLWSPGSPSLYQLEALLIRKGKVVGSETCGTGIRKIGISSKHGFLINGEHLSIRGTNRHQEYPYIGNALSDNAQYRDAWKIKEAGFNFVRSSHYPQSPAFLNACDELGILVMNAIPGWQFFGDSLFREISYQNTREMCRRDRNHPSVILWEASLNETVMPVDFMEKSHGIVHSELPFSDIYTCGWMDTVYDVFIPARQHASPPDYWSKYPKSKPILIAEYGSWEYYAQNAGFHQTEFKDLMPAERSSRQLRGYGERQLLQQEFNFQEAYNDNLNGPAIGSSNWVMFDYNRGYATDIESSGIMDIFRIPKFTFWFYRSQCDKEPVCFIASYNNEASSKYVRVFSNGDSVALYRNGVLISARKPDSNANTTNLVHPPFTFMMKTLETGILKAEAFLEGKSWAEHSVTTAGKAANLSLEADISNRELKADGADAIFIYASITDLTGNTVNDSKLPVHFTVEGDARLIGDNPINAEAGIAAILLKAGRIPGKITVKAESPALNPAGMEIVSVK